MLQYQAKRYLLLFMCLGFSICYGQETSPGNTDIISEPVYGDVIISYGTLKINAPIHGNLVVKGGTIDINDTVDFHVFVLGGKLTSNGYVGGDIRMASGEAFIKKDIGRDLIMGGGLAHLDSGITIHGVFFVGAGDLDMHGAITVRGKKMKTESPDSKNLQTVSQ